MVNRTWTAADLQQPHISFSDFQLWIHGRRSEALWDYWDGNWLQVTVHCGAPGTDVGVQGSILHLGELEWWLKQLEEMSRTMSGTADLAPAEPNRFVGFEMDKLEHIAVPIRITPEQMSEHHEFRDQIDQSYLPGLIQQLRTILQDYPIRGERPGECKPPDQASRDRRLGRLRACWNRLWGWK